MKIGTTIVVCLMMILTLMESSEARTEEDRWAAIDGSWPLLGLLCTTTNPNIYGVGSINHQVFAGCSGMVCSNGCVKRAGA